MDEFQSTEPAVVDLEPVIDPAIDDSLPPANSVGEGLLEEDLQPATESEEAPPTDSESDSNEEETGSHYALRQRSTLRKPARYCNAAQLLAKEFPAIWSGIVDKKGEWLRRGRRLRKA